MTTLHLPTDGASGPTPSGVPGGETQPGAAESAQTAANVVWIAYEGIDGEMHYMTREDFLAFEEGQLWGMMMEFFPWDEIPEGRRNRQLPTARKPRGKVRPFLVAAGQAPESWRANA